MKKNKQAFSLLETILYIAISSTILTLMSFMLITLLGHKTKNYAQSEIESQGLFIMETIQEDIRNAKTITNPTKGSTDQTLILQKKEISKSPIIFELTNKKITRKEGLNTAQNLNSEKTEISEITFETDGNMDTEGTVKITFKINFKNTGNHLDLKYEKIFTSSANIRSY